MKGLLISLLIVVVLVAAGFVVSIIMYNDLNDKLTTTYESGFEKGHTQGYLLGLQEGSRIGYQEGSKTGYAKGDGGDFDGSYGGGFYFVYNPTYDELPEILAEAEKGSAKEIHDYAAANGIRVAYVRCQLARQAAEGMVYISQLVAFKTVDNGLVIIEPWSHREVRVEVGQSYSELNGLPAPPYDDTITKITVVW